MDVRISSELLSVLLAEAAKVPDSEVCGLFARSARPTKWGWGGTSEIERILEVRSTPNVAADPSHAFEIDPAMLFAAIRAERAGGPAILGHYHSHPDDSTQPSAVDAAMADRRGLIVAGERVEAWREMPGGTVHAAFQPIGLVVDG